METVADIELAFKSEIIPNITGPEMAKKSQNVKIVFQFQVAGFELTYCDTGNSIPFPIFTMQTFLPSQKIMIPRYNTVSCFETEKQNFYSVVVKNNFNMYVPYFMRTVLLLLDVH